MNLRNKTVKFSALYFFIYCPLGVVCPLIGQYLSSIGFSGAQVGVITSLGTGTAIFAGMFWGQVYANTGHKRQVIAGMCLAAGALALVSMNVRAFFLYAMIYSGMYFFQGPLHGLCDALTLKQEANFSLVRAFGAMGYAVAVFTAGRFAEATQLSNIFYLYGAAYVVACVLVMSEAEPPAETSRTEKVSARALWGNRQYAKLLLSAFFVMGTNVANSTYFGYLFREGGGSVAGIGLAFLLMAGSEAPFMALTPILVRRFGSERVILAAMVISAARFGFYATGPSSVWLLGTFFLQGMANGVLLVELVKYVNRLVESRYSGVAIATYYAIGNSLSVIVCSLVGGIILDMAGARGVYLFFSLYNMVAIVLYVALGLHRSAAGVGLRASRR